MPIPFERLSETAWMPPWVRHKPDQTDSARMFQSVGLRLLAIDRTSLICALLCSFVFGFWTVDLTHSLSPAAGTFFVLAPLSIYYLGRGALRWLNLPADLGEPFPLAFVTGSIASCLLLFVLDFLSPLPIQWNCGAVFIVAILLQLVPSREARVSGNQRETLFTVLAVIVTLAAATFWTRDLRPYASQVGNEVVFRPWSDHFIHAQIVSQVRANRNLLQLGNADLAGLPLPFYHYASYIFPACVSAWTGQTAYDSLATFWTPFGIVLTGLAAYALGRAWWSCRAGLAALIGVLLMPDASTYGLNYTYYSFHWLVLVCPGLLYGIAAASVALLLVTRGLRPTNLRSLGAGFGLVVMCILIKAHLFIVVCPLLVIWCVLFKDGWTARQRLFLSLGLVTVAWVALSVADRFGIGPTILPFGRDRPLATYLEGLAVQLSDPFLAIIGVLLASLGVLALLFPVLVLFCYFCKNLQRVDALPALAIFIFLAGTFLLPLNDRIGNADDMRHRPFAWAYFVLAVWTWGRLVSVLDTSRPRWRPLLSAVLVVASITMLAWPWTRGTTVQDPHLPWSQEFINVRLASGRIECAKFLREHSAEEEIVQEAVTSDIPILGALAERRCYLSRSPVYWNNAPESLLKESLKRAELVRRIGTATTWSELREFANQTGVRWYVSHSGEKLDWPSEILARPAFEADGYKVFDLKVN